MKIAIRSNFSQYMREVRVKKQIKLKEMADYYNVTSSYLLSMENGRRPLSRDWLQAYVTYFCQEPEEEDEFLENVFYRTTNIKLEMNETDGTKKNGPVYDFLFKIMKNFETYL